MSSMQGSYGQLWERIFDLCSVLRGRDGCAWDRAQTAASLAPYLIEEVHEFCEALTLGDRSHLVEETGDAVYLWTFLLQALEEEERLTLAEAVEAAEAKLTRRHPHVFGTEEARTRSDARGLWERQKRLEDGDEEILRRTPKHLPALVRARRLQEKAAAFRFDWEEAREVLEKIREETAELEGALSQKAASREIRDELGDLLFSVVNLARHLDQDPEAALLAATEKFRSRFNEMARSVERAGHRMGEVPVEILESHWQAVKAQRVSGTPPLDR